MSDIQSYKEQSRRDWGTGVPGNISMEQIQLGAILRIADALERMTKPFEDLLRQKKWDGERIEDQDRTIARLNRSISAYKGFAKKVKNKTHAKRKSR